MPARPKADLRHTATLFLALTLQSPESPLLPRSAAHEQTLRLTVTRQTGRFMWPSDVGYLVTVSRAYGNQMAGEVPNHPL